MSLLAETADALDEGTLGDDARATWKDGGAAAWQACDDPGALLSLLACVDPRAAVRGACACVRIVEPVAAPLDVAEAWCASRAGDDELGPALTNALRADDEADLDADGFTNAVAQALEAAASAAQTIAAHARGARAAYAEQRQSLSNAIRSCVEAILRGATGSTLADAVRAVCSCPTVEQLDAAQLAEPPPDPIGGLIGDLQAVTPTSEWLANHAPEAAWAACRNARWMLLLQVWLKDRKSLVRGACICARALLPLIGDDDARAPRATLAIVERWLAGTASADDVRAVCIASDAPAGTIPGFAMALATDGDRDPVWWADEVARQAARCVVVELTTLLAVADAPAWNAANALARESLADDWDELEDLDDEVERAMDEELATLAAAIREAVPAPTLDQLRQVRTPFEP